MCPTCKKKRMPVGNKYCSIKCYEEAPYETEVYNVKSKKL